jgi:hypothetical protein
MRILIAILALALCAPLPALNIPSSVSGVYAGPDRVCSLVTPKPAAVNPTNGSIKALDALRLAVHDRRHEHHMATTHPRLAR